MTDNTAPNPASASQSSAFPSQNWEVVTFPGHVAIPESQIENRSVTDPIPPEPTVEAATPSVAPSPAPAPSAVPESLNHRTAELIQLIQDLNQCNDALLVRVSDLEESLERSQSALQAEVERHQGQNNSASNERPSPAPQQIAQLLTEIDIANDGLRRATIHNETLQTELESSQQRVAQLERECTLLQQRFSEKSTALQQAEDSCRDLKARLHRQQRYTLQFKTALEKCLNMAGESAAVAPSFGVSASRVDDPALHPVAMPKAQEIQPWSAKADPSVESSSLTHLLHSLKTSGIGAAPNTTAHPITPAAISSSLPTVSPAISNPVDVMPMTNTVEAITEVKSERQPVAPPPVADRPPAVSPAVTSVSPPPEATQPMPWPPATVPQPEPDPIVFTEPSPWGAPIIQQPPTEQQPKVTAALDTPELLPVPNLPVAEQLSTDSPLGSGGVPAYLQEDLTVATPAPVVYPSRSPKKISSLAAVQLPSFGRNARRS